MVAQVAVAVMLVRQEQAHQDKVLLVLLAIVCLAYRVLVAGQVQ
jgi:hypothetical protein